jgi:hypothetical protein
MLDQQTFLGQKGQRLTDRCARHAELVCKRRFRHALTRCELAAQNHFANAQNGLSELCGGGHERVHMAAVGPENALWDPEKSIQDPNSAQG